MAIPQLISSQSRQQRFFVTPKARHRVYWDEVLKPTLNLRRQWDDARIIVYIIRCDGIPVYIGQTTQGIRARLYAHLAQGSLVTYLHSLWPESVWSILIWEFEDVRQAMRMERRLILAYKPQCNLKSTGKDQRHIAHPSLDLQRLGAMYRYRDHWQRRAERRLADASALVYDCFLTLPNFDVVMQIGRRYEEAQASLEEITAAPEPSLPRSG